MYLKHGFTAYGEWLVNRERIPRYQIRGPADKDETLEGPGSAEDREVATIGKRVLMYFPPPLSDHKLGSLRATTARSMPGTTTTSCSTTATRRTALGE